jgi:hypothetical protein
MDGATKALALVRQKAEALKCFKKGMKALELCHISALDVHL